MKTVLLLAALLFALSSRLFALSAEREASKSLPGQSATLADLWRRGQLCQAANQHRARCHGSDRKVKIAKRLGYRETLPASNAALRILKP
jgi:hypothetical protein